MYHILRGAEHTGRAPRSLIELPRSVCERVDGSRGVLPLRAGEKDPRVSMRLLELSELLRKQHGQSISPRDAITFRDLVADIAQPALDSQRASFLACRGDVLLLDLLHLVGQSAAEERFHTLINEVVQIMAELAISDGDLAEAFATDSSLLALLFRLMAHKQLVDGALTLAQELLAIGPDVFPLASVPQLPELLESLTPRGLSLVGRALAVLLAKAAEDGADGLPAPECTPPNLCASCANNSLLLEVPSLLPRIVALLKLRSPPPGLWGHMLTQLPHAGAQGLAAHWGDEGEGEGAWDRLGEAPPAPSNVVVLLSPEQVPPALRDLIAANPAVLFPGINLPHAMQNEGGSHLHLHALQAALWTTLQADLLYLLWALMGSKTKVQAQRRLIDLGFISVLQDMFERLDWRPPPPTSAHHGVGHAAGCTCSPQSCLQMQLLRTLQALCEKDAEQVAFHRLLLTPAPPTPRPPSPPTRAAIADAVGAALAASANGGGQAANTAASAALP